MRFLWEELRSAVPLICAGNPYLLNVMWVTIRVAVISTLAAVAIGLPIGLTIGLGRFRGRRTLHVLANASLGLPPVVAGLVLFLLFVPQGPLGSFQLVFTLRAVYIAQTVLALPYVVALTAAAIQGLPPGLLAQARVLGAGRGQLCALALREAKVGVMAAVIAAVGSTLSEVGAVVIVGGNVQGYDQTLASAALQQVNSASYADAVALGLDPDGADPRAAGRAHRAPAARGRHRPALSDAGLSGATPVSPGLLLAADRVTAQRGGRDVVRDVSLELRAGEVVALLGPNGAGKSTLLDALSGVLEPARGTVERNGRVAVALQAPDLARRSVLTNVTLALAWWGVPRQDREARAATALETMGAGHLRGRSAATLSGGERRRVHLARAMAVRPDILMLDEPFAGLDPEARASLLEDAVSALRSDAQATLVVVHDRAEAWALADRLLVLIDGRLVASGPPRRAARGAAEC